MTLAVATSATNDAAKSNFFSRPVPAEKSQFLSCASITRYSRPPLREVTPHSTVANVALSSYTQFAFFSIIYYYSIVINFFLLLASRFTIIGVLLYCTNCAPLSIFCAKCCTIVERRRRRKRVKYPYSLLSLSLSPASTARARSATDTHTHTRAELPTRSTRGAHALFFIYIILFLDQKYVRFCCPVLSYFCTYQTANKFKNWICFVLFYLPDLCAFRHWNVLVANTALLQERAQR